MRANKRVAQGKGFGGLVMRESASSDQVLRGGKKKLTEGDVLFLGLQTTRFSASISESPLKLLGSFSGRCERGWGSAAPAHQ